MQRSPPPGFASYAAPWTGVDAHDRVEEAFGEREAVCLGVNRNDEVFYPSLADPGLVL